MLDMQPQLARPNGPNGAHPIPARRRKRAKPPVDRAPALVGWLSSDAEEIERRRWRGRTEIGQIEPLERDLPHFGSFRVRSAGGSAYDVEIRSLDQPLNSCGCADHRVNGLGTCKHIEGVLAKLRQRGVRAFKAAQRAGSPRVELFLPRTGDPVPRLLWPADPATVDAARAALAPFLAADGSLADASPDRIDALLRSVADAGPLVRQQLRVSRHLEPWLADARRRAARIEARARFEAEVEAGTQTIDLLHHPLLPYQREGMLHLAFGERALLADDMGLGKTIQAIAATELLRRLHGVARVLVVCPASLKGEWQEQIARFSGAATLLVTGRRPARLAQYAQPGFFTVVNYEQVVIDAADINRTLRPDIVILDEAQRIKNWHTKTARAVKSLASPYAFVLTGTPIENRIDEIYSIVQYLDPGLLGPLFRFNRDFYDLDERGRPIGYKNLDELMRRLQSVMLRRRKRDVETELPGRTVTNYLVGMADEQRLRYDEFKGQAARLVHIAQRRPLTQQEFERLQRLLACMRMLCDTPFILDPACRISPKLEELERVLSRAAHRSGPQGDRVLGMGAHADPGARDGAGSGDRGRLAHRLGAAGPPPRRDRALQARPRVPAVPVHRQRQRRAQPADGERGDQPRPAVEPGEAGAAHRARLAQEPDAHGRCDQPGDRGQHRARDAARAVAEAGAGRWRAGRRGRSEGDGAAVRPARVRRAHGGDDGAAGRAGAGTAPERSVRDELPERSVRDELIEQHGDALLLLESRQARRRQRGAAGGAGG